MIEPRNHMGWLGALVLGAAHLLDSPDDARANRDPSGAQHELQANGVGTNQLSIQ
jgi:hypothetical protein